MSQPKQTAKKNTVRVNVKTAVNTAKIRREKRNGRDIIIVPSATLPDDVVMNNIKYPADEIEKSYRSLERAFAPLGHPMLNNQFVSAADPEAINSYHVGAHNENVRRENGRVFLDKVIDIEFAGRTEHGKALLNAIDKGEPISTSTGVYVELVESNDPAYAHTAVNMHFDHDAILLDEDPAATPAQGVGMLVNKDGKASINNEEVTALTKSRVTVPAINSLLESYDCDVEWAAKNLFDAMERRDKAGRAQGFIEKIMSMLNFGKDVSEKASGLNLNHDDEDSTMSVTEEKFNALADKVTALSTNAENFTKSVTDAVAEAVKPLKEQLDQLTANQSANEEAERTELVAKIVANNLLDEESAKELSVNSLRKLATKIKPGTAAPIVNSGFDSGSGEDEFKDYNLNAAIDAAAGKK